LLETTGWYEQFGRVLVVEALENDGWDPTRLVYYAGGKIDFMIIALSILEKGMEYDRPFRVLLDKDGLASSFRAVPLSPMSPPTEAEFLECVNHFYAAIIMWAKQVTRGDPWAAKIRDRDSKERLLQMLEWDQRARKGWDHDTWYLGLRLRRWVDPELIPLVEACWCGAGVEESARAIRASMGLFDMLSSRTACALGYTPFDSAGVAAEVEALLAARSSPERDPAHP
jgi:aminoglycoside 6-adenylyltransferase